MPPSDPHDRDDRDLAALRASGPAGDGDPALRRLGDVSGRACAGSLLPVQAVVERPRRFYVVSNDVTVGLGEPVFDLEGGCVGLVTFRQIKTGGVTYFLFSGEDPYSAVIVLPLADIMDGASQHEKFKDLAK